MDRKLSQEEGIIMMNLGIYSKAQENVWKQPDELSNVVLRLVAFHKAMTFQAVIGKRFS